MTLIDRIRRFARSPQGQQARSRAERAARDPRNQAKIRALKARLTRRR